MRAPCKEVNNTQSSKYIYIYIYMYIYIYLYMTIETIRSICFLWTGYFQDDPRKHVAIIAEDKNVVTTDGKETVA